MSKTKLSTECYVCDSEFKLEFSPELVSEHENIVCPFCGNLIEDVNETEKFDEEDDLSYAWDDEI